MVLDQNWAAQTSAMSIEAIDLAVAGSMLANFLMDSNIKLELVWIKNNKGRRQPAT